MLFVGTLRASALVPPCGHEPLCVHTLYILCISTYVCIACVHAPTWFANTEEHARTEAICLICCLPGIFIANTTVLALLRD